MKEGFTSILSNDSNTFKFTVNTAVNSVASALVGAPNIPLKAANSDLYFPAGNGCIVESIGLRFPYQFTKAEDPLVVGLQYANRSLGWNGFVTEFTDDGRIEIPTVDCLIEVNQYIPYPSGANGEDWFFRIFFSDVDVSQLNCPAALDTLELDIFFYMIVHSTEAVIV